MTGYKELLPDFLRGTAWEDLITAMDDTFAVNFDTALDSLKNIRHSFNPSVQSSSSLSDESSLVYHDRSITIRSLRMKGFSFSKTSELTDLQLFRLNHLLPYYWRSKGSISIQNFLSVVLNSRVYINSYWTDGTDYLIEGSSSIGTSVIDGGSWYPTTFIQVVYQPEYVPQLTPDDMKEFIYALAPYNLVIRELVTSSYSVLRTFEDDPSPFPEFSGSKLVSVAAIHYIEETLPVKEI